MPRRSWPCALLGAAAFVRLLPVQVLVVRLSSRKLVPMKACALSQLTVVCIVRCVCSVALLQLFCAAGAWACPSCTLVNKSGAKACDVCDKPRPGASGRPWLVPFDAAAGRRDLGPDAGAG